MPRTKSLLVWEPLPYLVLVALLLGTGFVRPTTPAWILWPYLVLIAASLVWVVVSIARERRRTNPDQWGNLADLAGIELVAADPVDRGVRAVSPVDDVRHHQSAVDLARIHGGAAQEAVLVSRASKWMSRRYRVGVQLIGGDRPRHAGYLAAGAEQRWGALLDGLRSRGRYVRVPALITGEGRPFGVELDLSGLEELDVEAADSRREA